MSDPTFIQYNLPFINSQSKKTLKKYFELKNKNSLEVNNSKKTSPSNYKSNQPLLDDPNIKSKNPKDVLEELKKEYLNSLNTKNGNGKIFAKKEEEVIEKNDNVSMRPTNSLPDLPTPFVLIEHPASI